MDWYLDALSLSSSHTFQPRIALFLQCSTLYHILPWQRCTHLNSSYTPKHQQHHGPQHEQERARLREIGLEYAWEEQRQGKAHHPLLQEHLSCVTAAMPAPPQRSDAPNRSQLALVAIRAVSTASTMPPDARAGRPRPQPPGQQRSRKLCNILEGTTHPARSIYPHDRIQRFRLR